MSILRFLASKMPVLFSSEYRDLKDKVKLLDTSKKELLKNSKNLEKELVASLEKRLVLKESVKALTEIYTNLKYGASVVSLSEFHGIIRDLGFSRGELKQLEGKIKELLEQRDLYTKELLERTADLKSAAKALERFGVLIKL